jgi:hypothetical protein
MLRSYIITRHLSYTRFETDHPPVSPNVSEAWTDFVAWRRDGLYQSPQPMMPEAIYRRVFSEQRPFHDGDMSAPRPEGAQPCRWWGETCLSPKPRPNLPEHTSADLP